MFELSILCPQAQVEDLSDALQAMDALSVSVEDADALGPHEKPLFGEPGMPPPEAGWQRSRVLALYSSEQLATESVAILKFQDFFSHCTLLAVEPVADQDWVRLTQSQFAPVEITPDFWIVPTWHQPPVAARTIIRLDPGLAFGTGTHPTTRMCLRWIANHPNTPEDRVLDYGCGSGILAIAAAKYGALQVDAFDIDEAAVNATVLNAQANQVVVNAGLPDRVSGTYQTVLANILATPLKVLAPLLWERVAPGGTLILAGILNRLVEEIKDAYAPYCVLKESDAEDGWSLMTAAR